METNFKNLKTEKEKIDFIKEKIREYFVPFENKKYIEKDKWGRWTFIDFPTFENFLNKYEIDLEFWERVKTSPELFKEIGYARNVSKDIIIKGGLSGGFNPKFTTLAAQNLIGWSSKAEMKSKTDVSVLSLVLKEADKRGLTIDTTAKVYNINKNNNIAKKMLSDSDKTNDNKPH